jgi:4'-phosphopantetheinyl transferase
MDTPYALPSTWRALNPVLKKVPPRIDSLRGSDKTRALSAHARTALRESADLSGVALGPLEKGERGRPLPTRGVYWSLSHTVNFVAAVVAPYSVGVDIERISPFTPAVRARVAGPEEWDLADAVDESLFCRYWTAKEAVLKAVGIGISGLGTCRITEIIDETQLRLSYETQVWIVSSCSCIAGHIASVTAAQSSVCWRST